MVRWFAGVIAASMLMATASAATTDPAVTQAASAPADRIRCKRYTETGTLAKVHKECHTQAEWQQIADKGRQEAREMMSRNIGNGQPPH